MAGRGRKGLSEQNKVRQVEMVAMYKGGKTLQEIGDSYGITRERVRQLIKKAGVTKVEGGQAIRSFLSSQDRAQKRKDSLTNTESRIFKTWGLSLDAYRDIGEKHGYTTSKNSPLTKYSQQRRNAIARGIEWKFDFPTWWNVWQESGKWDQRGRGNGYVMARYGDSGPYAPENVYICTSGQNFSDSYIVKPWKERFGNAPCEQRLGCGKGYTFVAKAKRRPYQAQCSGKVIGRFATPEEARAAYLAYVDQLKRAA